MSTKRRKKIVFMERAQAMFRVAKTKKLDLYFFLRLNRPKGMIFAELKNPSLGYGKIVKILV